MESSSNVLEFKGKLRVPLGDWIQPQHQQWEWTIYIPTQLVVREEGGIRQAYRPLIGGTTRGTVQLYSLNSSEPDEEREAMVADWAVVTPVFSDFSEDLFSIQKSGSLLQETVATEQQEALFLSFQDRLLSSADFFRRLIGPFPMLTDATMTAIGIYIKEGTLLTCSDGSMDPEQGTACQAWLFADREGHVLWQGAGPVDGNPEWVTSYRSELGGIAIILYLLQQMVEHLGISVGSVTLYCDNQGALDNVFDEHPKRGIFPMLARDYDFLGVARKIWRGMPIRVQGVWVKGHYKGDDREIKHDLNDVADYFATQFQRNPPEGFRP